MMLQPRFGEIDIQLDTAQDFIADDVLVAKLKNCPALHLKRFVRKSFELGGKQSERRAGTLGFGAFHLADMIFVFDAQPLQRVGFRRVAFPHFI